MTEGDEIGRHLRGVQMGMRLALCPFQFTLQPVEPSRKTPDCMRFVNSEEFAKLRNVLMRIMPAKKTF